VTNNHVIDPGVSIRVRQGNQIWPAQIDHISLRADLCRLRVEGLYTVGVELRPMNSIAIGERAYTVGAPEELELSISEGLVSGIRDVDGGTMIQTSAAISHGSSGGGLFDGKGDLIGLTTSTLSRGQNLNFAVPVENALEPRSRHDPELIAMHAAHRVKAEELTDSEQRSSFDLDRKTAAAAKTMLLRNPNDWELHFVIGRSLSRWDPHRALSELDQAVRLSPDNSAVHQELGRTLGRVGDPRAAVRELREGVRLDPRDQWARAKLIGAFIDDENMTAAIAEARTFADVVDRGESKLPIEFLQRVATWMVQAGDHTAALAVCQILDSSSHGSSGSQDCFVQASGKAEPR
jgi:hypothetical protein